MTNFESIENPVLIGGLTSFGSGVVMRKLSEGQYDSGDIIDTSGLNIFQTFKIASKIKGRVIVFQPSLAFYSWTRDIVIALLINIFAHSKYIIFLCDPNYCKFRKFANFLVKKVVCANSQRIYIPGEHKLFMDLRKTEQLSRLHHLRSLDTVSTYKRGEVFYLYANYLTADKGLNIFLSKIDSGEIVGSGSVKIDETRFKLLRTNNKLEFDSALDDYSRRRPVYCYLSKYDLSPLIIQEVVSRGIIIGVFKNSRAEEILNDQFYKISYVYLDEVNISTFLHEDYDLLSKQNIDNLMAYIFETSESKEFSQDISVVL